jgi:hypothetical protein
MFVVNMAASKNNDFIGANFSRPTIDELEAELSAMAQGASTSFDIEWCLRHAIFAVR